MICTSLLTIAFLMNYSLAVLKCTRNILGDKNTSLDQDQCHDCHIRSTSKDLAGKNNVTDLESIMKTLIHQKIKADDPRLIQCGVPMSSQDVCLVLRRLIR